ncbi:hypothetical protein JCM6882_007305 [Rhodosporidiobolus microsporus]
MMTLPPPPTSHTSSLFSFPLQRARLNSCPSTVPLPDESRPGKASDLIKRFQAKVDASKEDPLVVSSSFAAPGKPRLSATTGSLPTPADLGRRRSSAAGLDEKPLPPPPVPDEPPSEGKKQEDGPAEEDKKKEDESLHFRSAGLSEKPTAPPEEQGKKNAKEAFPDMQEASAVDAAAALEAQQADSTEHEASGHEQVEDKAEEAPATANSSSLPPPTSAETDSIPLRNRSPIPHPVVTQPSLDVPAPAPVPGSADLLSGEASPVTDEPASSSANTAVETLSPRSPSTPKAHHESLSRPTSPRADDSALRVPPTREDDSPPPPEPSEPASHPTAAEPEPERDADHDSPSASRRSPTVSRQNSLSPTLSRSGSVASTSPRLERTTPASRGLHTPTASSLAKARSRVHSGATSPTHSRSSLAGGGGAASGSSSPSLSSNSGRRSSAANVVTSPSSVSAPFMSPSSSRDSNRSMTRQSPALGSSATMMARQRSSSITSTSSAATASGGTPKKHQQPPVPTSGTPRSRKAAAEAEKAAGPGAEGKTPRRSSGANAADLPPSSRAKTPSGGRGGATPSKKPWGAPSTPAKTPNASSAGSNSTKTSPQATRSPLPSAGGGSPANRGRGGATAGRKMASRGRVGLAGARGGRSAAGGEKKEGEGNGGVEGEEKQNGDEHQEEEASSAPAPAPAADTDDIPVFAGFGSRPVGKIGIPMVRDEETGEMKAKRAEEVEAAGRMAGVGAGEEDGEAKEDQGKAE